MCVFFPSSSLRRKKNRNPIFGPPWRGVRMCGTTPPPHWSAVLKPPRKWPNFSNFEFLFWHCIGIIENNISTKFGDNRTNFGEIITISRFQCFLYSSGHSARGTSIVSTLLSLKNFWLEVRSWNFACSCRKGWSTTMHVFVRWACPGESQYRCGTTPPHWYSMLFQNIDTQTIKEAKSYYFP